MVFHTKPFKKDLTPFAKGGQVVKHVGKGAREQSGGGRSLTGGDSFARMSNRYPKSPSDLGPVNDQGALGGPSIPPSPVPMGTRPPGAPTAMMPPSDMGGGGEPDEDDAA